MTAKAKKEQGKPGQPVIQNRRARHDYHIDETMEVGIVLTGTEVKSIRNGRASLTEGYIRASEEPLTLTLHSVHIAEYPPAGPRQHLPTRERRLLAHAREIRKLAEAAKQRGTTIVPLKMYFSNGRAKLQIGVGRGKKKHDKRQAIAEREAKRDIDRAMSRRR